MMNISFVGFYTYRYPVRACVAQQRLSCLHSSRNQVWRVGLRMRGPADKVGTAARHIVLQLPS